MLSVLDLLINHSYLAGQMKSAMREEGKSMPPEVKELMAAVKGHAKGAPKPVCHGVPAQTIAPIP
jgi:anaerobic magnesium-protoporphyrin IX monomethyl ester cyclase